MAWNPKGGPWGSGGGGSGGGGPWGSGPSSPQPPDVEAMLRRTQEKVRRILPGGMGGWRGILLLAAVPLVLWLLTGFYRIQPGEQGVEMLFGQFVKITPPGLNFWWPTPIGEVEIVNVEQTNTLPVGFRGTTDVNRDVPAESLMLTSDQNIIDSDFVVQWRIKNPADFIFNIRDPENTIKLAAESAMREVMGQTALEDALTVKRQEVDEETQGLLQSILDQYGAGVDIVDVKQLKVDPPSEVIDAFNDVQRARQDLERAVNEGLAYRNDIVPRARGAAVRLVEEATAYKEKVVREAEGEASRFLAIYNAYTGERDVTRRRLYLERMQEVLGATETVIIDNQGSGQGVVPYLPLPELRQRSQENNRGQETSQ